MLAQTYLGVGGIGPQSETSDCQPQALSVVAPWRDSGMHTILHGSGDRRPAASSFATRDEREHAISVQDSPTCITHAAVTGTPENRASMRGRTKNKVGCSTTGAQPYGARALGMILSVLWTRVHPRLTDLLHRACERRKGPFANPSRRIVPQVAAACAIRHQGGARERGGRQALWSRIPSTHTHTHNGWTAQRRVDARFRLLTW